MHAGRHLEPFEDLSGFRIDAPQIALVPFPGRMPEFAVDPTDAGDEAVRLDGAKHGPGLGIDLVDLAASVISDPERSLGPGKPRIAAPP